MLADHIQKEIREQAGEAQDLLKTLAQIPAPTHHERKRATFCRKWLTEAGCKNVFRDKAGNIIYPYGVDLDADDDTPLIVFAAHMDTVFPDTEPMPIKEYRERLYCPGIYDDTANLVNLLLAARLVTQHDIRPDGVGILFVCDVCEEGMGNLKGIRHLFEDYGKRIKAFYTFDLTYDEIVNHAVGSCRYRVAKRTEGGHSYLAFGHDNAIQKMSAFIQDLYCTELPAEGKSSYNVGLIEGGTSVNTIAQLCSVLCEYRSDSVDAMQELDTRFRDLFKKHGLKFDVIGVRPGEKLDEAAAKRRDEMLDHAADIIKGTTGITPTRLSSSTDCNIPLSMGIPAICLGTVLGKGAHTREEYLEKSSLIPGRMIATELVLSYCQSTR